MPAERETVQTRLEKGMGKKPGNKIEFPEYFPKDEGAILLLETSCRAAQGTPSQPVPPMPQL